MTGNMVAYALGFFACTLLGVLIGRFTAKRHKRHETEAVKLATLKATMRTVQLIVNNFLNHLLLVELEIKDHLRPHALDQLEQEMQVTFKELKALGDVASVEEVPFALGPLISYPQRSVLPDPSPANGQVSGSRSNAGAGKHTTAA